MWGWFSVNKGRILCVSITLLISCCFLLLCLPMFPFPYNMYQNNSPWGEGAFHFLQWWGQHCQGLDESFYCSALRAAHRQSRKNVFSASSWNRSFEPVLACVLGSFPFIFDMLNLPCFRDIGYALLDGWEEGRLCRQKTALRRRRSGFSS